MKLGLLLAATTLALTGCAGTPRMNNDMIIVEAMKCDQAGLPWRQTYNYDGTVSSVICVPLSPSMRRATQGPG